MQQASASHGACVAPNNSIPIKVQAMGVFVPPAKTATIPKAAMRSIGAPVIVANEFPNAAPTKKSGVTSPPLNPDPKVIVVNINFQNQLQCPTPPEWKLVTMEIPASPCADSTPSPR